MLEMGIVVGIALLFSMAKMNWNWRLRVLSSPLIMDALIFIGLLMIHWGTFSGVMVATIGALTCSAVLAVGRYFFGHIEKGVYVPGKLNISHKLK